MPHNKGNLFRKITPIVEKIPSQNLASFRQVVERDNKADSRSITEVENNRLPEIVFGRPGGGYGRHSGIDKLRALCAFLIVCIHSPFPGVVGEYFIHRVGFLRLHIDNIILLQIIIG